MTTKFIVYDAKSNSTHSNLTLNMELFISDMKRRNIDIIPEGESAKVMYSSSIDKLKNDIDFILNGNFGTLYCKFAITENGDEMVYFN